VVENIAANDLHIRPDFAHPQAREAMYVQGQALLLNTGFQHCRQSLASPPRAGRLVAKSTLDADHDGVHSAIVTLPPTCAKSSKVFVCCLTLLKEAYFHPT
jgi:hypothetical protein